MKKVFIATSRSIGENCRQWAKENMPEGFEMSDRMSDCDVFISVLYDKIIPHEYIDGLTGAFNFHPGVLPEYRGAATYSWAIINGEKEVGVTLHKIDDGIDSGDVIQIQKFTISESDTAQTIFTRAESVIEEMFRRWFRALLLGEYPAVKQNEQTARIYYRKDLERLKNITHIVRALHFPGKESCYYFDNKGIKHYINYETTI